MRLSVITPAFNEADNLVPLYERLSAALSAAGLQWEWLIIDDHSVDRTFEVIQQLAVRDSRVRGLRFARNSGSHTAIACGLHHATGDAAAILAADLQDPPEMLAELVEQWIGGAQVVWAVRRTREGDGRDAIWFARAYYFIVRHLVGLKEMPASGADCFLVDRVVIDAFRRFPERHVSVLVLITWMGFRQAFVPYDRQRRHSGRSGWTLAKKITLVVDSVTAFSCFPLRLCSYTGAALMFAGVATAVGGVLLLPSLGAGLLLMLAVVVGLSGVQLLALGAVGEYVWRALDESRRRPPYLIEAMAGQELPLGEQGSGLSQVSGTR